MRITHSFLPFVLVSVVLLLVTGCRSHREMVRPSEPDTAASVLADTAAGTPTAPSSAPHYYTANFTASAQGYSASGQLRVQSDSIVWLSASKIVELARARFTPDSAVIYVKVMGRAFRGSYADLYKRFHYRTTFDELYRLVLASDAEAQLAAIISGIGLDATVRLGPVKEVDSLSFPMVVPDKVAPL